MLSHFFKCSNCLLDIYSKLGEFFERQTYACVKLQTFNLYIEVS